METRDERVVVVVRPGKRTGPVMIRLRQLLPAAVLLVAPASLPTLEVLSEVDSIIVEADEVDSPMSLADAIAKSHVGAVRDQGSRSHLVR